MSLNEFKMKSLKDKIDSKKVEKKSLKDKVLSKLKKKK